MQTDREIENMIIVGNDSAHQNNNKKAITHNVMMAILWLLSIYFIAIYLFEIYEGWGLLDSVYFVTSTISTVGYGDLVPQSSEGKIIAVALMWVGISVALYIISNITSYRENVLDKEIVKKLSVLKSLTFRKKKRQ